MIDCRNLTKIYRPGSTGEVVAVKDVSFTVAPGEVLGLLGANGAGKTSTLRTVATILAPTAGDCLIDGVSITEDPEEARRKMGYLSGETRLYERLTPFEIITYFGQFFGMPLSDVRSRREQLVRDLGMAEYADQPCGELSTGRKQMVSIARALVHDPKVLVLDEPTVGLDVFAARRVLDVVRALADEGRAVLFSTHIMSEVEKICDRVAVIHKGALLTEGTVEEIMTRCDRNTFEEAFFHLVEAHDAALA
ncbi:MAG: ABC transporter ATP-binding protein [Planctomycetota bacterium]